MKVTINSQAAQRPQGEQRVGPGLASLIMILVVICLAALSVLALVSAQADEALTLRHQVATEAYYAAAAQMQREIAAVDQVLLAAREAAAGDASAYAQTLAGLALSGAVETMLTTPQGGVEIWLAIAYGDQHALRATLAVPADITGPRYTIRAHTVSNEAQWQPNDTYDVFQ